MQFSTFPPGAGGANPSADPVRGARHLRHNPHHRPHWEHSRHTGGQ